MLMFYLVFLIKITSARSGYVNHVYGVLILENLSFFLTITSMSTITDYNYRWIAADTLHLDFPTFFIRPSRDGPYYVIGYGRQVGVHTGFCTITLVLYIETSPNLGIWFPCGRGRTLFILGSLGQRSRSQLL